MSSSVGVPLLEMSLWPIDQIKQFLCFSLLGQAPDWKELRCDRVVEYVPRKGAKAGIAQKVEIGYTNRIC